MFDWTINDGVKTLHEIEPDKEENLIEIFLHRSFINVPNMKN